MGAHGIGFSGLKVGTNGIGLSGKGKWITGLMTLNLNLRNATQGRYIHSQAEDINTPNAIDNRIGAVDTGMNNDNNSGIDNAIDSHVDNIIDSHIDNGMDLANDVGNAIPSNTNGYAISASNANANRKADGSATNIVSSPGYGDCIRCQHSGWVRANVVGWAMVGRGEL
eukprot:209198-Amorphochlora_amoeboformis.AAC.2